MCSHVLVLHNIRTANCNGSEFIAVTLQSGQSEHTVHFAHSKQRNKLESQIFSIYLVVYWEVALQKEIWRGNKNCAVPETSWLLASFRRVNLSICMCSCWVTLTAKSRSKPNHLFTGNNPECLPHWPHQVHGKIWPLVAAPPGTIPWRGCQTAGWSLGCS